MFLRLYKYNGDKNVINKTLITVGELEIFARKDFNIFNPELRLFSSADFNYMYIEELQRYYFINSIEKVNADINMLFCETDVLMTFKEAILNSECIYKTYPKIDDLGKLESNSLLNSFNLIKINSDLILPDDVNNIILSTSGAA